MAEMLVDPALQSRIHRLVASITGADPGPDDNLFRMELLDSLKMVELILDLEEEFELQLSEDGLSFDHLQSVSRIAQWVESCGRRR